MAFEVDKLALGSRVLVDRANGGWHLVNRPVEAVGSTVEVVVDS